MRRSIPILLVALALPACKAKPKPLPLPPALQAAYGSLAEGDYDKALASVEPLTQESPAPPGAVEAQSLKAYLLAYGKNRSLQARDAARIVVSMFGSHPLAPPAQQLIADTFYWQGNLKKAMEEYKRLADLYGDKGYGAYAYYQIGNCLYLQQKPGDALASYRDAAEKYPGDPLAGPAQLRVGEVYAKVDNPEQAKSEFLKAAKTPKDPDVQAIAQSELESLAPVHRPRRGATPHP